MKLSRQALLIITLLTFVTLACRAVSNLGSTATIEPTAEKKFILFQDDFSDTTSGWSDIEDHDGVTGYRDGGYRIQIQQENWFFWSTAGKNFTDVIIDVDAAKTGGPDNNEFGVICRYRDDDNFYILSISSDGFYGISKFIGGELYYIGMEQMLFNDKIIQLGNTTNHIKASCIGDNLTIEVNGEILADVVDSELSDGDVGLIAATFDETGTNILFDNFIVSRP